MSSCLLSTAVMYLYETNLAFCAMKMVQALAELHQTYPKLVTLLFVLPKQDYHNNS